MTKSNNSSTTDDTLLYCSLKFGIRDNFKVSFEKPSLPDDFQAAGVTPEDWETIVYSFASELMPAVGEHLKMEQHLGKIINKYRLTDQVRPGFTGNATAWRERQVWTMANNSSILLNNVTMLATNLTTLANALLNPYGICAQLKFTKGQLPSIPDGGPTGGPTALSAQKKKFLIPTELKLTSFHMMRRQSPETSLETTKKDQQLERSKSPKNSKKTTKDKKKDRSKSPKNGKKATKEKAPKEKEQQHRDKVEKPTPKFTLF
ncbi:MAG: hypothetical protein SGILL_009642 [Bacillariaceae sp.]